MTILSDRTKKLSAAMRVVDEETRKQVMQNRIDALEGDNLFDSNFFVDDPDGLDDSDGDNGGKGGGYAAEYVVEDEEESEEISDDADEPKESADGQQKTVLRHEKMKCKK